MKNLICIIFIIFMGCVSTKNKISYNTFHYKVVGIQEYQYAFAFKVLNDRKDTLLVISLKDNYYDKYNHKKPKLKLVGKITIDKSYDFILSEKKPTVSTMEQLGAFIIIENDTVCKAKSYKELPLIFISHNTIGKFYDSSSVE